MLDAARELFVTIGYESTSLSEIINRSGGSRSSLYEFFGNKEGLLRAIVKETSLHIRDSLDDDAEAHSLDEAVLVALSIRFVTAALTPTAIAIFRIVNAECPRNPSLAEFFYDNGPRIMQRRMSERFRNTLGLSDDDPTPERMATVFLGAIMGDFHFRQTIGLTTPATPDEIESKVTMAVRLFLRGVEQYRSPS